MVDKYNLLPAPADSPGNQEKLPERELQTDCAEKAYWESFRKIRGIIQPAVLAADQNFTKAVEYTHKLRMAKANSSRAILFYIFLTYIEVLLRKFVKNEQPGFDFH